LISSFYYFLTFDDTIFLTSPSFESRIYSARFDFI